jgi:predicted RNA-binding Zn ribbon-like protein
MVNNRHEAPGSLELVRRFLNTWAISSQTHAPEDRLPALASDAAAWRAAFDAPPPRAAAEHADLLALRSGLRQMLAPAPPDAEVLNGWLDRVNVRPRARAGSVVHEPVQPGLAGLILASVIDALAAGEWTRLKACHDCQWVFYDHTRNASRRWCGMNAEGPEGRACGSIAKVRRYRERQSTAHARRH